MSSPFPYLIRMLLFLVAVAGLAYVLHEDLLRVFLHTPTLDSVILGVLLIGIGMVFRQVIILWPEVSWMRRYQNREPNAPPPPAQSVNLLAPMAAMVGERQDQIRLSPTAARAVLDGIASRLDERRELARYMIGLLIFLGLLGTFWGLLQTIGAVADAINSLQVTAGDAISMFAKLKGSIEGPLKGMSTAFGASLFGLSGSLVLGFLELQASQAQGRFHTELEEWLARATSLSSSSAGNFGPSVPAYVEALLERNTEGVDDLIRAVQRIEESRQSALAGNAQLVERLAALAEAMRAQQNLLARFTELSIDLRGAVDRLSERAAAAEPDREAAQEHQRAVEKQLGRLTEETLRTRTALAADLGLGLGQLTDRETALAQQRGLEARIDKLGDEAATERQRVIDDLQGLLARVAERTAAESVDREAALLHRRTVENRLETIAGENERTRAQMADDLHRALARLRDRSAADADREAIANLERSLEGRLARLVEENTRNRAALAEELRAAVERLAERFADADRESVVAHQRVIEAQLARLVEDGAANRAALADELRSELRLLARTLARAQPAGPGPEAAR
ncbi:MAG TPA: hypothetical protein VLA02_17245 [Reyranella sp.]|nr:hypothetical protein [Reyranella sp.]